MKIYEKNKLINKSIAEARDYAEKIGMTIRVSKENGETLMGTCDYNTLRINVEIKNGIIIKILSIG